VLVAPPGPPPTAEELAAQQHAENKGQRTSDEGGDASTEGPSRNLFSIGGDEL
jgi:hypothetical protein